MAKKSKTGKKPYYYKKKKVSEKKLEQTVSRIIESKIETKKANSQYTDNYVGGVNDSTANVQIVPVTPYGGFVVIPQGAGDGQRIGNKIKTQSLDFTYTMFPNPYDGVSNVLVKPLIILMFLLRDKKNPADTPSITDIRANLYNAGGTVTPATGTVKDLTFSINTDRWHVYKKWTHKLGYSQDNIAGVVGNNQYFQNNDFHMFIQKKVVCTKGVYKTFTFDDNSQYPATPGLSLFYYCVFADGSTMADGQYPVQLNFAIDYKYKDA